MKNKVNIKNGEISVENISLTKVSEGVYWLNISTKEKWPAYNEGSYNRPDDSGIWFELFKNNDDDSVITNSTEIEISIPGNLLRAVASDRYGLDVVLVDLTLFKDKQAEILWEKES